MCVYVYECLHAISVRVYVCVLSVCVCLCVSPHVGVVLLQQCGEGLQQSHQELSRLAEHPARLGDEDPEVDSSHLQLALTRCIRHREVLWQLRTHAQTQLAQHKNGSVVYNNVGSSQ